MEGETKEKAVGESGSVRYLFWGVDMVQKYKLVLKKLVF
jgi:hypothetical protein